MRHNIDGKQLGRNSSLRKATIRDIAKATLIRQRVCTTKTRAKEARRLIDRLITLGKKGSLAHKRRAFAILCDHGLVSDLFKKTSPRFKNRQGGYTRIIPLSNRRGDNAQMVYLELTEKDEMIVSKARSAAAAKTKQSKDVKPVAEKKAADPSHSKPETHEEKKEKVQKVAPPPAHSKHDIVGGKDKGKTGKKNIMGGFKNMFTKKPSE